MVTLSVCSERECFLRNRVDDTMNDIASLLHRDDTTIAIVGATDDPAKYGSVIYRDLKHKGFEVFAVNPNRDTVDGDDLAGDSS